MLFGDDTSCEPEGSGPSHKSIFPTLTIALLLALLMSDSLRCDTVFLSGMLTGWGLVILLWMPLGRKGCQQRRAASHESNVSGTGGRS